MICASQKEESVAFMVTDKKKCGGSVVEVEALCLCKNWNISWDTLLECFPMLKITLKTF